MTWIVKVGDQYLAEYFGGGSAICSKLQHEALRFKTPMKAVRVALRTFGLWDGEDEDDWDMEGRVVRLVPKVSRADSSVYLECRCPDMVTDHGYHVDSCKGGEHGLALRRAREAAPCARKEDQ